MVLQAMSATSQAMIIRLTRSPSSANAMSLVHANIGSGSFWAGAAESYGALLARSGLLPEDVVDG